MNAVGGVCPRRAARAFDGAKAPWVAVLAVAAVVWAAAALAGDDTVGLIVRQRRTGGVYSSAQEEVLFFGARKRVVDTPRVRTIFDRDARTITVVNKRQRTFFVRTFDEMSGSNAQPSRPLEGAPSAVCSRLAAIGNLTLKPTGRTEKIAGLSAKEYALEGGAVEGSVWVAEGVKVPAAAEWEQALGSLGGGDALRKALADIGGLVVRTRTSAAVGKNEDGQTEAIEVRKGAIAPELLEVPAGLRRVAPPLPRRR